MFFCIWKFYLIIDLHSHTTSSDGSLTPVELLQRAENRHVDVLAITDHDTTEGADIASEWLENQSFNVKLVKGVEISTKWHGYEIHIVGLNVDTQNTMLQDALVNQRKNREIRALSVGEKLAKLKIEGVYDEAKELAGGKLISRTHFARALVNRGEVSTFDNAFKKYLGKGKKAYVSPHWMDIESAVKIVHNAGGLAVLAHPVRYDMSNKWLTKLIEEFAELGGDGIEVGLAQQSHNQKEHMSRLANQFGLYSSLGSDFHGISKWNDLGRNLRLTEKCKPIWHHKRWPISEN